MRAVVDHGLSKVEAARQFNTTPKTVAKRVDSLQADGVIGLRYRSSKASPAISAARATNTAEDMLSACLKLVARWHRGLGGVFDILLALGKAPSSP